MKEIVFDFGFALRFRNKREVTAIHEDRIRHVGANDVCFSNSHAGVLVAIFTRSCISQEVAVRSAADQLLEAVPDATLFEVLPSKIDRMAVRRSMMGFPMPWRFLDQGLPELESGGLVISTSRNVSDSRRVQA